MLAPPQRTVRLCGESWTIRPPRQALDVLEVSVYQYARFAAREGSAPSSEDMRMVCAWVAAHVVETTACDAAGSVEQAVDEVLTWPALIELREEIVDIGSIDADLIEGVRKYWKIAAGGGCECPACKDGKLISPERRAEFCLYAQVSQDAKRLASQVVGFNEDPDPSQPYWLFQIKQARLHGKLDARGEQQRKQREKEKKDKILKERGYK